MNLDRFEDAVRAATQPAAEPASLATTIDRRIGAAKTRQTAIRRVRWAFAACAGITLALVAWPAVSAQAQLRRIAGALEDVSTLLMKQYSVDPSGKRIPSGFTAYQNGRWRMENAPSNTTYYIDGKRIWLDPFTKSYVSEGYGEFFSKGNGSMKLSALLGSELGVGRGVEIDRDSALDGRRALRARFINSPFNERHTIYADPETDLPILQEVETKESGTWRLKHVVEFSYPTTLPGGTLDLDYKTPLLSREEWQSRIVDTLAKNELGAAPLKQGRVVVRAVDVAEDGTVYVAYQSGDSHASRWTGHGLEVTDSLGTRYCHAIEIFSGLDEAFIAKSKDGKLEVEALVPLEPVTKSIQRTVKVTASIGADGSLSRVIRMGVNHPDGTVDISWGKNRRSASDAASGDKQVVLCTKLVTGPTCEAAPSYMQLVDLTSYGNDIRARMSFP
jgi:hypothetical protein